MHCPNRNHFCYVCGLFIDANHKRPLSKAALKGFTQTFSVNFVPYLWYTPEVMCDYCYRNLIGKSKTQGKLHFKYVSPAVWLPRLEHLPSTCYFCDSYSRCIGFRNENREQIRYGEFDNMIPARQRSNLNPAPSTLDMDLDTTLTQIEDDPVGGVSDEVNFDCFSDVELMPPPAQPSTSRSAVPETQPIITSRYVDEGAPVVRGLSYETTTTETSQSDFVPIATQKRDIVRHLVTQADWEDIVRDAKLPRSSAELIGSRLKSWNLVANDFKITALRDRVATNPFDTYFIEDEDVREYEDIEEDREHRVNVEIEKKLVYCNDVNGLLKSFGLIHDSQQWRLFIDGSVKSLKVCLLHNGNQYPSVPLAYATKMKESYPNLVKILQKINYNEHQWQICADLKIVGLLMGLKSGFAKHQCFLCLWEGRQRHLHYTDFTWNSRLTVKLGEESIINMPLVNSSKIILPPLHIKLGLVKNFVLALKKRDSRSFEILKTLFKDHLTEDKINAGARVHSFLLRFWFNSFSFAFSS